MVVHSCNSSTQEAVQSYGDELEASLDYRAKFCPPPQKLIRRVEKKDVSKNHFIKSATQPGKNPVMKWEGILSVVIKDKTMHRAQVRVIPRMSC